MKPLPTGIPPIIILAGASGDPGLRIVRYLLQRAASVRALVRKGSKSSAAIEILQNLGFFFLLSNPDSLFQNPFCGFKLINRN